MSNDLPTVIELLVLAADQTAPWLASGDQPLVSGPVQSDVGKYGTAEQTARWFLRGLPLRVLHQTSSRDVKNLGVETWVAIPDLGDEPVVSYFPDAAPVTPELLGTVGRPFPHGAAQPPLNRTVDVLQHALRHIAWLIGPFGDANIRAALEPWWPVHLRTLQPALATLYTELYQPAAERLPA
jgi:hypothetical protein